MDYVEYPLLDNELDNVLLYVDDCFRQVSSRLGKGERVLIHCVQGVSRSVALVTAFVMRYNFSSFDQAYLTVSSRYSDANIADNFKRSPVIDQKTGQIDTRYNQMAQDLAMDVVEHFV